MSASLDLRGATAVVHFAERAELGSSDPEVHGLTVRSLSAIDLVDERALLFEVATSFEFPEYYGRNWDAMDECLRDLSWLPAAGYVLVVTQAMVLWQDRPRLAGKLVEAWQFAAIDWSRRGTPFHLVFEW